MTALFAVDLSEPPTTTRQALTWAQRCGTELLVLHVVATLPAAPLPALDPGAGFSAFAPYALFDPNLERELAAAREHQFEAFLRERFPAPVRAALREGDPAAVILEDAHTHGVDLIMLGKRHHSRLERWLLGSVTRHVVEHAEVPTLLLPIADA